MRVCTESVLQTNGKVAVTSSMRVSLDKWQASICFQREGMYRQTARWPLLPAQRFVQTNGKVAVTFSMRALYRHITRSVG
jgi:hypothetical protein